MTPTTSKPPGVVHCTECSCLRGRNRTSPGPTVVFVFSVHTTPAPFKKISASSYRCLCGSALESGIFANELRDHRRTVRAIDEELVVALRHFLAL